MNRRPDSQLWHRFLAAEAAGRSAEAEAALSELFGALARPSPQPGFSARVMAGLGSRRSIFASRPFQVGLAAALVVAALSAVLAGPPLAALASWIGPAGLAAAGAEVITHLSLRLAAGLALWSDAGVVGAALARAARHPQILALILTQFLIAAAALWGLVTLAVQQRSSNHAAS